MITASITQPPIDLGRVALGSSGAELQAGLNHLTACKVLCEFTDEDSLTPEFEKIVLCESETLAVDALKK